MVYALVVEDEEDIRNPLVEQLQDKGCIVKKADNGAVALKRAAEQTLDIIFVDVNMPVMDGFFFISELQQHPDTFEIFIVVVTAIDFPEVKDRADALGVKLVLNKPWLQHALDLMIVQAAIQLNVKWEIPASASLE
ncbi:MAG: response regulator [Dehalococcoidia bacterium]|nr:response regulator [Dehalococcoidia bacterium]